MREVVGATIGSLGAVLGGCCYGCCKGGALVSWWDLWVLFRVPQLTTRKGGITNRFGGCKSGTQSNAAVG